MEEGWSAKTRMQLNAQRTKQNKGRSKPEAPPSWDQKQVERYGKRDVDQIVLDGQHQSR